MSTQNWLVWDADSHSGEGGNLPRAESAFCSTVCFDSPGDPLRTVMAEAG